MSSLNLKVLIADDDPNVCEIVRLYFEQNQMQVIITHNGKQAIELVRSTNPDFVILDIMMPEMDGLEACRILRTIKPNLPIMMLSAKDEELDRVLGLEIGADDYVTKPFSPRELVARIKAIWRRTNAETTDDVDTFHTYDFGRFKLDTRRRELTLDEETVFLRPKEFDLLVYFAQNERIVLTRDQILQNVWGYDFFGDIRTVDVHIKKLRQKLSPYDIDWIHTVWGVGYRFDPERKDDG